MTLTQIQYVLAVAETGTISAAAKRLFIAQPSLTASIKELENELQVTLFRRTNKGVTLTPEGEEFIGYARQVVEQYQLIESKYVEKENQKKNSPFKLRLSGLYIRLIFLTLGDKSINNN